MPEISEDSAGSRNRIIRLLVGNHGIREISKIVSIPPSTVSYIARKWRKSGLTANLKISGRPSNLKNRDLRYLKKIVRANKSEPLKRVNALLKY